MALDYKPFGELSEDDILRLRTNAVRESRTIEYKRELPGSSDGERKEYLADISAFANTLGGYILYGVEETEDATPKEFPGVATTNVDDVLQALSNLVRDSVNPRLEAEFRCVEVGTAAKVVVARVPRSAMAPHMVAYRGSSRFFTRDSVGKAPMDVDQIRAAFLRSGAFADRLRQFRLDRVDEPISLQVRSPKVYLHLVPQDFLSPGRHIALAGIPQVRFCNLANQWMTFQRLRHNFDGVLLTDADGQAAIQVFRNSILEASSKRVFWEVSADNNKTGVPWLWINALEKSVVGTTETMLQFLAEQGGGFPVWLLLSMVNVDGVRIRQDEMDLYDNSSRAMDRDVLLFSEVLIERSGVDLTQVLRPLFDQVWNAAGHAGSRNYDSDGKWSLQ